MFNFPFPVATIHSCHIHKLDYRKERCEFDYGSTGNFFHTISCCLLLRPLIDFFLLNLLHFDVLDRCFDLPFISVMGFYYLRLNIIFLLCYFLM